MLLRIAMVVASALAPEAPNARMARIFAAGAAPTSGIGIYLNNTKSVELNSMNIHDFDNYGIFGSAVQTNSQFTNIGVLGEPTPPGVISGVMYRPSG